MCAQKTWYFIITMVIKPTPSFFICYFVAGMQSECSRKKKINSKNAETKYKMKRKLFRFSNKSSLHYLDTKFHAKKSWQIDAITLSCFKNMKMDGLHTIQVLKTHANVKLFSYRKGNCGSFGCYLLWGSTYWLTQKNIIA